MPLVNLGIFLLAGSILFLEIALTRLVPSINLASRGLATRDIRTKDAAT
jgi:hypothetical protein